MIVSILVDSKGYGNNSKRGPPKDLSSIVWSQLAITEKTVLFFFPLKLYAMLADGGHLRSQVELSDIPLTWDHTRNTLSKFGPNEPSIFRENAY